MLYFDDIQFSSQSVPEPMHYGFAGMEAAFAFFLRHAASRQERSWFKMRDGPIQAQERKVSKVRTDKH
jgi:hypothetical protein